MRQITRFAQPALTRLPARYQSTSNSASSDSNNASSSTAKPPIERFTLRDRSEVIKRKSIENLAYNADNMLVSNGPPPSTFRARRTSPKPPKDAFDAANSSDPLFAGSGESKMPASKPLRYDPPKLKSNSLANQFVVDPAEFDVLDGSEEPLVKPWPKRPTSSTRRKTWTGTSAPRREAAPSFQSSGARSERQESHNQWLKSRPKDRRATPTTLRSPLRTRQTPGQPFNPGVRATTAGGSVHSSSDYEVFDAHTDAVFALSKGLRARRGGAKSPPLAAKNPSVRLEESAMKSRNVRDPETNRVPVSEDSGVRHLSLGSRGKRNLELHPGFLIYRRSEATASTQPTISYTRLREMCSCDKCIHITTRQRTHTPGELLTEVEGSGFLTDLPTEKQIWTEGGKLRVQWGQGKSAHQSTYTADQLESSLTKELDPYVDYLSKELKRQLWSDPAPIEKSPVHRVQYSCMVEQDDPHKLKDAMLKKILEQLQVHGIVVLAKVPTEHASGVDMLKLFAEQIGRIRQTFYGELWDVKNKPNSTNVAYTALNLGLHMDLM